MKTRARVGVELELAVRWGYRNRLVQFLQSQGFDIGNSHKRYTRWCVKTDPSVETEKFDSFSPTEIISPVMNLSEARRSVRRMLRLLGQFEDYVDTNYSTGVHINVSLTGAHTVHDINPVELISMVDERRTLKRWGRLYNEYCEPYYPNVMDILESYDRAGRPGDMVDYVRERLDSEKYSSVNFCHYDNSGGWIEYRMLGGDYLKRRDDVMKELDRLADITVQCATGDARSRARNRIRYQLRKAIA